jgi:pimeloyl-ACP methyl ester carboxylesterase
MLTSSLGPLLVAAAITGATLTPVSAGTTEAANPEIGTIAIGGDITLRRLVVHNPAPKGTVLFLHGFPETSLVWRDIAAALGDEFEVHAFDWPGYGLSSRPAAENFSYSPRAYAGVLKAYIDKAGIDRSKLTIYAADIGALPALLLALDEPDIARRIIVGDFAPFNRPAYMHERLQNLKAEPAASRTRAAMNQTSDEILENAYRRGLPDDRQFDLAAGVKEDMVQGWSHGALTSADAFYHYYAAFTRDQDLLEANLGTLKTPVKVIWGEKDIYIDSRMGAEFAERTGAPLDILPGIGHYPHLQAPERVVAEIRVLLD